MSTETPAVRESGQYTEEQTRQVVTMGLPKAIGPEREPRLVLVEPGLGTDSGWMDDRLIELAQQYRGKTAVGRADTRMHDGEIHRALYVEDGAKPRIPFRVRAMGMFVLMLGERILTPR